MCFYYGNDRSIAAKMLWAWKFKKKRIKKYFLVDAVAWCCWIFIENYELFEFKINKTFYVLRPFWIISTSNFLHTRNNKIGRTIFEMFCFMIMKKIRRPILWRASVCMCVFMWIKMNEQWTVNKPHHRNRLLTTSSFCFMFNVYA